MSFFIDDINFDLWEYLHSISRHVVLYGMGDGAEKIKAVLDEKRVCVADIMASDDFVRGHSFLEHRVKTLSEIEEKYGDDFVILVCFGSRLPGVMEHIKEISKKHELFAPCVPVAGDGLFDLEFANAHKSELETVYKLLADDQSKKVFENVIRYKLSGVLDHLFEIETPSEEKFDLLNIGIEEIYADLGAYDGDTVVEFLNETSMQFKKIYAMEPDGRNFRKMKRRLYMIGSALLECYNVGAWNEDTSIVFNLRSGRGSHVVPAEEIEALKAQSKDGTLNPARYREVKMMRPDTMFRGEPVTYIKMDVEGAEANALNGAAEAIAAYKPKLNIALYHRNEDIFELPLLVNKLNKKYKLYMRHHPYIPDWETNLYCI